MILQEDSGRHQQGLHHWILAIVEARRFWTSILILLLTNKSIQASENKYYVILKHLCVLPFSFFLPIAVTAHHRTVNNLNASFKTWSYCRSQHGLSTEWHHTARHPSTDSSTRCCPNTNKKHPQHWRPLRLARRRIPVQRDEVRTPVSHVTACRSRVPR